MAIVQMAMDLGDFNEGTSENDVVGISRQIAQMEEMLQSHSTLIDGWSRKQETLGSSMQQLVAVVREMRPTVESLKSLSEILRRRPDFPITNAAKEQRMAGG
jgi:hypothetical protein